MTGHITLSDKYASLPSASSTAANTPAATEDRPFIFPSALSRHTSRLSERTVDDEKAKEEKDLESGQQTPAEQYLPSVDYVAPEKVEMSTRKAVLLGAVMMSTTFVASATLSSSLLCIPSTAADLGVTELQAQWVSSAYSLANGVGLLVSGRLADIYGRKMLFLLGMAAFLVMNVISGVIRSYIGVCVLRALAGLSISISLPAAFGILGVNFTTEPRRTIGFAALALGYPVAAAVGLVIGGAISGVSSRGWQYVFFVDAGLALPSLIGGVFLIPAEPARRSSVANRKVDWVGAFLVTAGLSLFSFALTQSGVAVKGWSDPYIPVVLVIGLVLIVVYGFWEHWLANNSTTPPLTHLSIFTRQNWKVTAILIVAFFAYIPISGWLYLTTIWFQNFKNDTPIMNAVHIIPAPIFGVGACVLVPLLAPRVRAPVLLMMGSISTGIATVLFAVTQDSTIWWSTPFLSTVFDPPGADLTVGIGSVLMSNLVDEDEQSLAGALFQTSLQIASTVGITVASLTQSEIAEKHGLLKGLQDSFWLMSGFCWLSAILAIVTLRGVGLAKDVGKKE
ncbi:hypothetical protein L202_00704 [Cryptococcus amylolentus CBS 6039]|uniref:Major facilitator superfamily (MFS) profile domain-containing protein n=2 Tax=Cryptococcus amylolentus TaxID=104669 RepID=A0A1E3IAD3_9TREE|nr:hypothetical protein L202_00704 [Cryptococcus amylolentus CBS 6039]ODN84846.1 hypothetical protein L202_00704 [Cryptococcus amylolentus CBS 6039]ODO11440.1 hypothetical protein I350_00220 [Cryptococcus amylolentus CBS 6273]